MDTIYTTLLDNVSTFLFILYPVFMYKISKLRTVNTNDSWLKLVGYSLLLIAPPLWLLWNGQLANILLGMMILGVYYWFKGVLDNVNEIGQSK